MLYSSIVRMNNACFILTDFLLTDRYFDVKRKLVSKCLRESGQLGSSEILSSFPLAEFELSFWLLYPSFQQNTDLRCGSHKHELKSFIIKER